MSAPLTSGMFAQGTYGRRGAPRALSWRSHLGLVAAAATLLATAPLSALFDGWAWLFHGAVTVAIVVAAATAARSLRAPVWAQALTMLAALLLAVTWQFRSGAELLGILPTGATLQHAALLLGELPSEMQSHAVPVPGLPSFLLTTTLGIGLVAIVVDLCAVGARRPAVAGLPLLAVYSVPVAVMFTTVPAYTFAIGVLGYLWLLGTDNLNRVRQFGRRFTGDGRGVEPWEPSPLAATGRRLAAIGVAVAVALPLAVPGVSTGLVDRFGSGFAGIGGTGSGGGATAVNLFATLDGLLNRDETVDMLDVTTDDSDPHYLRIGVADEITADGFDHRPARGDTIDGELPGPVSASGVTLHEATASVVVHPGFSMPRLPTYAGVRDLTGIEGRWRYDRGQQVVFAGNVDSAGQEYEFTYARSEFDPDALRQVPPLPTGHGLEQVAHIPPELHQPEVSELVAEVVGDLDNPYDQVLAIQHHFSTENGFTYSLETGDATTGSAIVDFLIHNQQGYCVQYAAAMTWMVRELELPARVVIGFTSGRTREAGEFTLTNHNAHAWPEVYFEGFGWVPFEPTPRSSVAGSVTSDWAPDPNAPDTGDSDDPVTGDRDERPDAADPFDEQEFPDEGMVGGGGTGSTPDDRGSPLPWLALLGALLLVALLLAPAVSRAWARRRRLRPAAPEPASMPVAAGAPDGPGAVTVTTDPASALRQQAHAAWEELLDTMVDLKVPLDPAETPRVTAARVLRHRTFSAGGVEQELMLLGQAEERARYAPTPMPVTGLPAALQAVRQELTRRVPRTTRMRAALLPPSTLHRWQQHVSDLTGRVTAIAHRGGAALARLSPRRLLRSTSS